MNLNEAKQVLQEIQERGEGDARILTNSGDGGMSVITLALMLETIMDQIQELKASQ